MSHGEQKHYNEDKILHCQFVTQPLAKNHQDQWWEPSLWATFITLRSIALVRESEDAVILSPPELPQSVPYSSQKACECVSAPTKYPSMTRETFSLHLKQL